MQTPRDHVWLELVTLVGILMAGAVFRFWLSTALPFDDAEMAALAEAMSPGHGLRVPFIMVNGVSLFAFYVIVRRSAGPPAALAALLALQTSVWFQTHALRIEWAAVGVLAGMLALAALRLTRPSTRLPARSSRVLLLVVALLLARGAWLGATLPDRLDDLRTEPAADPAPLFASLEACGGGAIMSLDVLHRCDVAWPETRSLVQQSALLDHRRLLGLQAVALDGRLPLPDAEGAWTVVYDEAGVGLLAVPDGPAVEAARRAVQAQITRPR